MKQSVLVKLEFEIKYWTEIIKACEFQKVQFIQM